MKLNRTLLTTIAVMGLVITEHSAHSALVYNTGDLFLAFRATGSTGATQDYVVDIGQYSQFTTTTNTFALSLGDIGQDLEDKYGSGWFSRSDLFWSITGTPYDGVTVTTPTLYVSRARTDVNTPATAWLGRSNSAQVSTASSFQALAGAFASVGTATGNSSVATFQNVGDSNSYASFTKPTLTTDFNVWNTIQGTSSAVQDLFQVNPVFNQAAVRQGSFQFDSDGNLYFTGASVPEPSTVALVGVASAVALYMTRRRRQTLAS